MQSGRVQNAADWKSSLWVIPLSGTASETRCTVSRFHDASTSQNKCIPLDSQWFNLGTCKIKIIVYTLKSSSSFYRAACWLTIYSKYVYNILKRTAVFTKVVPIPAPPPLMMALVLMMQACWNVHPLLVSSCKLNRKETGISFYKTKSNSNAQTHLIRGGLVFVPTLL